MLISVKEMFNAINKFPLAAIPFFILAGNIMETGGISRRLVDFAKSLVGGVQGGLPMTCVLTCMIFAAISGSSVATTSVSYTHLDVYKRQGTDLHLHRPGAQLRARSAHPGRALPCLLYTSRCV